MWGMRHQHRTVLYYYYKKNMLGEGKKSNTSDPYPAILGNIEYTEYIIREWAICIRWSKLQTQNLFTYGDY